MTADIETIVIGAGAVGLAVARALAIAGHEVMVLEQHELIGSETSSMRPCHGLAGSVAHQCAMGRSITNASSATDRPGKLWPPLRTATRRPCCCANFTAEMTSATPAQRAISAGRLSIEPFQILRAWS